MIWIQNQLVGAAIGQKVTLECNSEAYPKSINYWMKNESIITPGELYEPELYRVFWQLYVLLLRNRTESLVCLT